MIKKGTYKQMSKITGNPSRYKKYKKLHFAEEFISLEDFYQCKRDCKKRKYIEFVTRPLA